MTIRIGRKTYWRSLQRFVIGLFRVVLSCWIFWFASIFFDFSFCPYAVSSPAFAADERSPYGSSKEGEYGEKHAVSTKDEARKILKDYFSKKNARIGKISEKDLYFEAEIRDDKDKVIDIVIVDKRTGRIRSIY